MKKFLYQQIINLKMLIIGLFFTNRLYDAERVKEIGKVGTLFVCAHPDDETLFFYSAIKAGKNSCVLCLDRWADPVRSVEFGKAMQMYGIQGIMGVFSDKKKYLWMWKLFLPKVLRKVKRILRPDVVYTHNEMGEYGHYDHKIVNLCVRKVFSDCTVKTSDDVAETEQEKQERRQMLSNVYVSQDLKSWFPEWY